MLCTTFTTMMKQHKFLSFLPSALLERLRAWQFLNFWKHSFQEPPLQLLIVIVPMAAPATIGYLGQKSSAATILGADNHLKIMTCLLNVLEEVDSTDAIILATTCRTVPVRSSCSTIVVSIFFVEYCFQLSIQQLPRGEVPFYTFSHFICIFHQVIDSWLSGTIHSSLAKLEMNSMQEYIYFWKFDPIDQTTIGSCVSLIGTCTTLKKN